MRKRTLATKLGSVMLAFALAAGTFTAPVTQAAAQTKTVEETKGLTLSKKTYKHTYKLADGRIYKTISYEYPLLAGNGKAAAAVNRFYAKKRAAWIKEAKSDLAEAKKYVSELTREGYYSNEVTCEVTCNDGRYLSIRQQGYVYTLGAHGMPYWYTYTFDAKTGRQVTPMELLGLDKKETNAKVRRLYLRLFDKTKDSADCPFYQFSSDDRADLKAALAKLDFTQSCYVKNGRVYFYADPYVLGPYAAGFIEVSTAV